MITLKIIVGTINTTMEKIMLRRGEVFQSPSGFGFRKIFGSPDPDLDPCETIRAMMARPGTNLEGGSRIIGTGRGRCDCPATNRNRYDVSTSHQNPCHSSLSFSFYLLASTHRRANELRAKIVLRREK